MKKAWTIFSICAVAAIVVITAYNSVEEEAGYKEEL